MLDEQLVFNIFANTGSLEAYLLYAELKSKETMEKKAMQNYFGNNGGSKARLT